MDSSQKFAPTTKITHQLLPVWNAESQTLLLGTIPSPKSREAGFYYMHPQNRFWKVLFSVFGEELLHPNSTLKNATQTELESAIHERQDFLLCHKIALWDVLQSCEISGAADNTIKNAVPNDFTTLFTKSKISRVFCTGKKAFALWQKYCAPLYKNQFNLHASCLPSTSPANAAISLESLIKAYQVIK